MLIFCVHSHESSAHSNSIIGLPGADLHHSEPLIEEENANQLNLNRNPLPDPFFPFTREPRADDPIDVFRSRPDNVDREFELFARIRLLENKLLEGLPPQSQSGEYELLIRKFLDDTITFDNYFSTMAREIRDITILEKKADLLDGIFHLLMGETDDRLKQILLESPFPERAIRTEALDFIVDSIEKVGSLNQYNLSNPGSDFERRVVTTILQYWIQDIQQHGHLSVFYLQFLDHFMGF